MTVDHKSPAYGLTLSGDQDIKSRFFGDLEGRLYRTVSWPVNGKDVEPVLTLGVKGQS